MLPMTAGAARHAQRHGGASNECTTKVNHTRCCPTSTTTPWCPVLANTTFNIFGILRCSAWHTWQCAWSVWSSCRWTPRSGDQPTTSCRFLAGAGAASPPGSATRLAGAGAASSPRSATCLTGAATGGPTATTACENSSSTCQMYSGNCTPLLSLLNDLASSLLHSFFAWLVGPQDSPKRRSSEPFPQNP